jgi:hypothetical protein
MITIIVAGKQILRGTWPVAIGHVVKSTSLAKFRGYTLFSRYRWGRLSLRFSQNNSLSHCNAIPPFFPIEMASLDSMASESEISSFNTPFAWKQTHFRTDNASFSIRPSKKDANLPTKLLSSKRPRRFVEHVTSIPAFLDFISLNLFVVNSLSWADEKDVLRKAMLGKELQSHFVGRGLSFTVRTTTIPQLPDYITQIGDLYKHDGPQIVAIKAPLADNSEGIFSAASEGNAIRAVAWECHVLSHPAIQASRHVVRLLGIVWEAVEDLISHRRLLPALAIEFADQGSLDDLLDSDAYCLSYGLKRQLVLDVLCGLSVLHQNNFIHGDVKTENVLLFTTNLGGICAKITDFGCSLHNSNKNAIVHLPGRSPPWDAPEVKEGTVMSSMLTKVDIYCWGLLVWRVMLNGHTPFDLGRPGCKTQYTGFEDLLRCEPRSDEYWNCIHKMKIAHPLKFALRVTSLSILLKRKRGLI